MIPSWVGENNYTDVPFLNKGTDTNGWDCYQLCKYLSRKHFDKRLPDVTSYINANDPDEVINTIREQVLNWVPVEKPKLGDVILFKFRGYPVHCGFVLDNVWMIHVMENCMTAVEKYKQFPWNQRYDSAYRYTSKN